MTKILRHSLTNFALKVMGKNDIVKMRTKAAVMDGLQAVAANAGNICICVALFKLDIAFLLS